MNHDLCLVAASEAAMIAALSTTVTNEQTGETQSNNVFHDGKNWISATHDWQLVPIGKLQTTVPVMDAEGKLITPPEFDDRFHMNILCNDAVFESLQAFDQVHFETTGKRLIIEPTNRKVVWAK
ncbi:hypothetical protein TH25_19245 [Thalassospira profundimaris]|uniref:Uncharacterized protein n=1 Tax=Thalassospira profundimaris TaxID=502049 RepID=A0A367WTK3_9PROT|nr:hypothetical protein [Thalassospira profundimaris]RCK44796.1 hypothetical protein TH25_19245 [Thalassospira profundimaris]